jgi:hypothetical protein
MLNTGKAKLPELQLAKVVPVPILAARVRGKG